MKRLRNILYIVFIFNSFFLFSAESIKESGDWIVAVSEFKGENLDKQHEIYKKIVSELFLIHLDGGAKRLVPLKEKKLRAIMEISAKKFKLIKERAKLIREKDDLFLSTYTEKEKKDKTRILEKKIRELEKKIYSSKIDINIAEKKFYKSGTPKNVRLWKFGQQLYKCADENNLAQSLKKDNISALISGTVKDVSGYMVINVKLDTGLKGMPVYEFYDAGSYEDVEALVYSLSLQLYNAIQNTKAVKVFFDVSPKNAKLYIDDRKISDFSKPIVLYQGSYHVSASAENYHDASKKISITDKNFYKLKINLKKDDTIKLGFDFKNRDAYLFYKTQYATNSPGIVTVPKISSILEFEEEIDKKKVHTYALIEGGKIGSPAYVQNMIVKLNKKSVKDSIERQRKVLYWSLGAFYISLPITMITNAKLQDAVYRYNKYHIGNINKLKMQKALFYTSEGITIALGVNYLIQLIIYLVKVDRALPRKAEVDSKKPEYKKLPIQTTEPKGEGDTKIKDKNNNDKDNKKDKEGGTIND